jgi:hypothetical protein
MKFTAHVLARVGLFLVLSSGAARAQPTGEPASLRVFLDCQFFCDDQYVRDELPIIDFVTEPTEADVHILFAQQTTGAGGDLITLTFLGQRMYSAMGDTLVYATGFDATEDDKRRALLHNVTVGLARYMARAGLGDKLDISAIKPPLEEQGASSIEVDPWNYWAFTVGGSGNVNGQATTKFIRRRANFSANRTTEELKISFSGNLNDSRSEFSAGDETIVSTTNSGRLTSRLVKSIGEQWAVGGTASVSTSSFQNAKLLMEIGPAIEYDFFPYSESTRKFLTVQYAIKLSQSQYDELTIFALEKETILRHSLGVSLSLAQKWGSVSLSTNLSHLLTNFDRSLLDSYNLGVFGSASVRLFRGLSLNGFASYNRIRDQIDLPGNAATKEEILLRSIQLPTGYSYFVNFGLTYRFGSIFNNVVNPRMGGGGRRVVIMG